MALGTSRARNWGKDAQIASLHLLMRSRKVAYKLVKAKRGIDIVWHLRLAGSAKGVTLPFLETNAELVNTRRGRWESRHPFDGRVLATGISLRDTVRATIEKVWH